MPYNFLLSSTHRTLITQYKLILEKAQQKGDISPELKKECMDSWMNNFVNLIGTGKPIYWKADLESLVDLPVSFDYAMEKSLIQSAFEKYLNEMVENDLIDNTERERIWGSFLEAIVFPLESGVVYPIVSTHKSFDSNANG